MSRLKLLGENIKKYRKQKGFSQNQLAELLDISREHLGCIEIGREYVSLRKLFLISDVLKIPLNKLIDFE